MKTSTTDNSLPDLPCDNAGKSGEPRWFALVNDRIVIAPRMTIQGRLLRTLASVPADQLILRDHETPNDEPIDDNVMINLDEGNVFITRPRADGISTSCNAAAKLALSVDDRFEIIQVRELSIEMVLALFDLPVGTRLVRDLESPHDEAIAPGTILRFENGPTFLTQGGAAKHVDVAIITTAGSFPEEGYERLPASQPVKDQLARAAKALRIKDISDWVATVGSRELDVSQSYAALGLSGRIDITYGKREGGGGGVW